MSLLPKRMQELNAQRARECDIRRRIERQYRRMRSFSPAMRKAFAERDIRAAMVAAGLPLPVEISAEEKLRRHVDWARRDATHLKHISDMPLRRAVIAALEAE